LARKYEVTIIGHVCNDSIITPSGLRRAKGGPPLYGGLTACRLGVRVAVVSKVGSAKDLRDFSSLFRRYGISPYILLGKGKTTTFEIAYSDEGRTIKLSSNAGEILFEEIPKEALNTSSVLISPVAKEISYNTVKSFFRYLKRRRALLSADLQGFTRCFLRDGRLTFKPPKGDLLKFFDIVKGSEREVKAATGCENLEEALRRLVEQGPKIAIVTLGEQGCIARCSNSIFYVSPLKPRSVIDPTGAGDAFIATFLAYYIQSKSLEECLRLASAAATYIVERRLPFGNVTKNEIEELAKNVKVKRRNVAPLKNSSPNTSS